ncbi:MAG: hypothetical protein C0601_03225 [Candidatus Muiribacterium halophilum]|uniref:Glycosyl transferase family 28 C-terminal domain-containing protein n=1 Tax=Muiribacterium halophilum TaxID=2053465 RepID=A0A2N5ZK14_MUIH1|nr:MAG: hypothetical protein C0601_03225 [Candidatus Muirbacterium halophilum]
MKKILFVCKVSKSTGTGHIRRAAFLSKFLESKTKILFFGDKSIGENICSEAIYIKSYIDIFNEINRFKPNWIVMDRQKNSSNLIKRLKKSGTKILLIEDDSFAGKYADIVWDANVKIKKDGYITGFEKVLLNPKVFDHKKKKYNDSAGSIFICLGGTDINQNIPFLIKNLSDKGLYLHVFPGSRYVEYLKYKKADVKIYNEKENIFHIARQCDIAIVSGGITMYEMVYLGIPTIVWPQVYHQKNNTLQLLEKNIIKIADSKQEILKVIMSFVDKTEKYYEFLSFIKDLSIGNGIKDFKNILEG